MELPALLSTSLASYASAENDATLLARLSKEPIDLILFFEQACEDETWCDLHSEFIESALQWLTDQFLQDRLTLESAQRIMYALQSHYHVLKSSLPRNLTVKVEGYSTLGNSLLLAASSEKLHDLIRIECRDRDQTELNIRGLSATHLMLIMECVETGTIAGLWKFEKNELFDFLRQTIAFKLPQVSIQCQEVLKRYINRGNVIEMLKMTHDQSWQHLEQICCDFVNMESWSVKLNTLGGEFGHEAWRTLKPFAFEFLEFNEISLDLFDQFSDMITHLICSGKLINDSAFSHVVKACPRLISLDISRSQGFSEYLLGIPSGLEELDLSTCSWLNGPILRQLFALLPHLRKLVLSSNVHLNYAAWSELQKLPALSVLDIARCHQLRDEDLSLILKSCYRLNYLSVEDCPQLTNKAFFEIARSLPQLITLNIGHCHITDGLLLEIISQGRHLEYLSLANCRDLTERGIVQAVRQGHVLKFLDLRHCQIGSEGINQIRRFKPSLKVMRGE